MRQKDQTLRQTLLDCACEVAAAQGPDAINMRGIAQKAGVATGTVYNYFSNKNEILLALTDLCWETALREMEFSITGNDFCEQLEALFLLLKTHMDSSAGRLMHSLTKVEHAGQQHMAAAQRQLEQVLLRWLLQDGRLHKELLEELPLAEQYAHFIQQNLLLLLREKTPNIRFFCTLMRRVLYETL